MRQLFHPFLPNGPAGDPVVWVDLLDEGRSVLLDLGDLARIPNRKLLRVDHVVVSHTHMDHFVGFDRLLRVALGRERALSLTGPPGFVDQVAARLGSYTWNLIDGYPIDLQVHEVRGEELCGARFRGTGRLRPEPIETRPFHGVVHAHPAFTVHVDVVDHGIPVLAAALRETERLAVDRERLVQLGLAPGPWLHELKQAVRRCLPDSTRVAAQQAIGGTRDVEVGPLSRDVLRRSRGSRLLYATDFRASAPNAAVLDRLGDRPDLMICETSFLDADRDLAESRGHLTAAQAGRLARRIGARRLAPFHVSSRYQDVSALFDEAAAAFGGEIVRLAGLPGRGDPDPDSGIRPAG